MRSMTYLNAMLKANRKLQRSVIDHALDRGINFRPETMRHFRQAQKFERRLRIILRELDELREIKAQ